MIPGIPWVKPGPRDCCEGGSRWGDDMVKVVIGLLPFGTRAVSHRAAFDTHL